MKTKEDPRHQKRVETMQKLFEKSLRKNTIIPKTSMANQVIKYQNKIDKFISQNAPAWPVSQIAPIDIATLRLAVWELMFKKKKEPYKVVIDEAVEIAKTYGSQSSPKFINGVLGSIVKSNPKIIKRGHD